MNGSIDLKCLIVIANRNLGEKISEACRDYAHFQSIILGKGTASSEILSALGIGEPEKDIVFCFIEQHNVPFVFGMLEEKFELTKKHSGIAMTIPVGSVGGMTTVRLLSGKEVL